MASWERGERTVRFLISKNRLESFEEPDASWATQKATEAVSGVKALLATSPPGRFG
jgi:hypothetical protein